MTTELIKRTITYAGASIEIIRQQVRFNDEKEASFEVVRRPPVALIIPILSPSEIIIIQQYRAAVDDIIWEFPAGKKNEHETILETATRELKEETGYQAHSITPIAEFYTSPHFSNEIVYVFLATQLDYTFPDFQDHEYIEVHKKHSNEIGFLFANAKIKDAKSVLAFHYYLNLL